MTDQKSDPRVQLLSQVTLEHFKQSAERDNFGIRMALLSNGTAIVILTTGLDKVLNTVGKVSVKLAMLLYFLGIILGGFVYLITWTSQAGAANHFLSQINDVLEEKKKFREVSGWGLNKPVHIKMLRYSLWGAFMCFIAATMILICSL